MPYTVAITRATEKTLADLAANDRRRVAARIDALAKNPRPQGCRKLEGVENLYRIRVGDYRIVYQVQDAVLLVLVVRVSHRREVYR